MKKQLNLGFVFVVLVFVCAACSRETQQTHPVTTKSDEGTSSAPPASEVKDRDNALVRVINTSSEPPSLDVFVSNEKLFKAVSFEDITPYKELPAMTLKTLPPEQLGDGRQLFRIRPADQDTAEPVAEISAGLTRGRHYTILVIPGEDQKTTISVINDNITPPPADKARVRVINASPHLGEVDIVDKQGSKELFSGINFKRETDYKDVDPMKTTLEIRLEGQQKAILDVQNANFEKGKLYTIVITGNQKGMPKLKALMVEDQLGGEATATSTDKTTT